MDYTILYILLAVVAVIGFTVLAKVLKERKLVSEDDLIFAMNALNLTAQIVDELKLKDEKKIKTITNVIILTTKYVADSMGKVDKAKAMEYANKLCDEFDIEITPERYVLIEQLLELSLKKVNDIKVIHE